MSNRREFIKQSGIITTGACIFGSAFLLEACKTAQVSSIRYAENKLSFPLADLPVEKKPYVVVQHEKLAGPVFIYRNPSGKLFASLLICPHKNCEVNPAGKTLVCPCHGSEFSLEGKLQRPPAEKDLFHYQIEENTEEIFLIL